MNVTIAIEQNCNLGRFLCQFGAKHPVHAHFVITLTP